MTPVLHMLRFEIPQTHAFGGVRGDGQSLGICTTPLDLLRAVVLVEPV